MNLEGIISKRLDAPYRSGRVGDWTKAKCRAGHEVVIGGYTREAGQLRSLLVGVHRGSQLVPVGRVGTGFGRDKVADADEATQAARHATRVHSAAPNAPRGGRTFNGSSRSSSPKSSSPAGQAPATCARRRSRACAKTSLRAKSLRSGRPTRRTRVAKPAPKRRGRPRAVPAHKSHERRPTS